MKFANENIIKALASVGPFMKEGRLFHRKNLKKSFKSRWFKLKSNLLYYYRTNEFGNIGDDEPLGVLVLASCTVKMDFLPNAPFVFSILFNISNERHYFCGVDTDQCVEWIDVLQCASYSTLQEQYESLKKEILLRTSQDEIHHTPKNAIFHRRIGKSFNGLPKRYEKRFQSVDKLKTPRDRSLDQMKKSVLRDESLRSGGALEQVRKSYSLANLLMHSENGDLYNLLSPDVLPDANFPSMSPADSTKKNNLFNFDLKHFDSKKKKRNRVKKQSSDGVTYKHYSHNYHDSFYDINHQLQHRQQPNNLSLLMPSSSASNPFRSNSAERIDFTNRKKKKKQPKRKSIDQQQVVTNEELQILKQSFNKNSKNNKNKAKKTSKDKTTTSSGSNSNSSSNIDDKVLTKPTAKNVNDDTLGIILKPLSLASNPFLSTYSKSLSQEKQVKKKKSILRHGYSMVSKTKRSKSKDKNNNFQIKNNNKDGDNADENNGDLNQKDNLCKFIQRPRSCTLAQLEKIPSFSKIHSNDVYESSNDEEDALGKGLTNIFIRCNENSLRCSLNIPNISIPKKHVYDFNKS
ncbi:hypothetical protein HELRODRAFT_173557 [Helobdella robusta]|uniref:Pleckstrin homology domain-containing family J member 1 n=1 Tax=Helobdella robusta TaxID=6412 RepID=T1F6Z0_HELRO|nr:hypothetical protein HELRODRAFT_173557 [Helobdella robusta]ESO03276.1 hypothetical protein HELRODRAFT_173557 [Helobdella robusta]